MVFANLAVVTIFQILSAFEFFVALSALAIGYIGGIRRNKLPQTANSSPEGARRTTEDGHIMSPPKIESIKMEIYCPKCGVLFNSEREMLEHYEKEHEAVSGEG